jgi:hypothetical protein
MMKTQALLVLALFVSACGPDPVRPAAPAPAPAPVARGAEPQPAPTSVASIPPARTQSKAADEPEPRAPLDPAGVLDEEERRLLEADDATLTREDRVARAKAQHALIMADSEHPLRPVLAKIEADVASGEARIKAQEIWSGRAAFPDRDDVEGAPPRG